MASLPYVCHPGYGKTSPAEADEEYIDEATLAALYGLLPGEYLTGLVESPFEIHLFPRVDGKYIDIKKELGDNPQNEKLDYPVNFKKYRQERYENII